MKENKTNSTNSKANTKPVAPTTHAQSVPTRGWSLELFNCLKKIQTKEFTLAQVYEFVPYLQQKYPNNTTIEASIRKLLQNFRDKNGLLEFYGNGTYRKLF